jgi:hypothetical protein
MHQWGPCHIVMEMCVIGTGVCYEHLRQFKGIFGIVSQIAFRRDKGKLKAVKITRFKVFFIFFSESV